MAKYLLIQTIRVIPSLNTSPYEMLTKNKFNLMIQAKISVAQPDSK